MENNIAIIDLGTNTFHLLIAERHGDTYRLIHREKQPVKIGAGGINQNKITTEGSARAVETLHTFKRKIDSFEIQKVFAFGTSAIRSADNRDAFIHKIKSETGIEIRVLSGDKEAEYIYWGIRSALQMGKQKSLIIDIGGGSVEFIIGNEDEIFWKKSYDIGGQRLLEQFQKSDPITDEQLKQLDDHFETTLSELFERLKSHNPLSLIGSSGTFDTLSEIFCLKEKIVMREEDPEIPMTIAGFYPIYNELITRNRSQRMAIPGMIEMRVDMIVVACCLIRYILDRHSFTSMRVSTYSLKEGALAYLSKGFN